MTQLLAGIPSALALIVGAFFVRKKAKEDTTLASLGQAITVWKEIADDARKSRDEIKKLHEEDQLKIANLEEEVQRLNIKIAILEARTS